MATEERVAVVAAVRELSVRGLRLRATIDGMSPSRLSSRWWGTFNQWKSLGGRVMARPSHVPPGKWGTQICFWSPVTKTVKSDDGTDEEDRFFVLRLYTVFCVDQVEGSHLDHLRAGQPDTGATVVID